MALTLFKQATVEDLFKDVYLRKILAERAMKVVRDVQVEALRDPQRMVRPGEVTDCLCEVVEAICLHGLKTRLSRWTLSDVLVSAKPAGATLPRPDYWPLVRAVTHRAALQNLAALDQITGDVGRCRAWVRLVLNEGTLASSIESLLSDGDALSSQYKPSAFLRDFELTSVVVRLFETIANFKFTLPLNDASFNVWQPASLMLCGLWHPPGESQIPSSIMRGVDADEYFVHQSGSSDLDHGVEAEALLSSSKTSKPGCSDEPAFSGRTPIVTAIRPDGPLVVGPASPDIFENSKQLADTLGLPTSIAHEIEEALKPSVESCDRCVDNTSAHEDVSSESEVRMLISEFHLDDKQGFKETLAHDSPPKFGILSSSLVTSALYDAPFEKERCLHSFNASEKVENCHLELSTEEPTKKPHAIVPSPASSEAKLLCSFGEGGWSSPPEVDLRNESLPKIVDPEEASFDSILISYARHIASSPSSQTIPLGTPELASVLAQVCSVKKPVSGGDVVPQNEDQSLRTPSSGEGGLKTEQDVEDDFEVVLTSKYEDKRTSKLLEIIGCIPHEKGLDQQNFECAGCGCSIGIIFGSFRKCSLDGQLYCSECMGQGSDVEQHVIPSRIVHDWDLRVHPVSNFGKQFLAQHEQDPLLDIRELNPALYSVVPELSVVQGLRRQLSFLCLYMFSCQQSAETQLKQLIWPREYLYEHVHLYSTLDLLAVPSGALQRTVRRACEFAKQHVVSCHLCQQKGFICELCSDPKVIFPFNLEETFFCERCSALYHRHCMVENGQTCNKCERRRVRDERLCREHQQ